MNNDDNEIKAVSKEMDNCNREIDVITKETNNDYREIESVSKEMNNCSQKINIYTVVHLTIC